MERDAEDDLGILGCAVPEVRIDDATDQWIGVDQRQIVELHRGEGRVFALEREVVDRPGRFGADQQIPVLQKERQSLVTQFAERHDGAEPHGSTAVGRGGGEGVAVADAGERDRGGRPEEWVGVPGRFHHRQDRGRGGFGFHLTEGLGREELHAGIAVGEQILQVRCGFVEAVVAEDFRRLGPHFRLLLEEHRNQRRRHDFRFGLRQLPETPDAVQPGVNGAVHMRRLLQFIDGPLLDEGELGLLPDALIGVGQQFVKFIGFAVLEAFFEELLRFDHDRRFQFLGVEHGVNPPAGAAAVPLQIDEVGDVQFAVGPEFGIGGANRLEEIVVIDDLEPGPFRFDFERF